MLISGGLVGPKPIPQLIGGASDGKAVNIPPLSSVRYYIIDDPCKLSGLENSISGELKVSVPQTDTGR